MTLQLRSLPIVSLSPGERTISVYYAWGWGITEIISVS